MGTWNFSEFSRIFPKGLNPLKIWGKIQSGVCCKYYNLNYCGILKLSQWKKLFIKFISSSLQISDIFGIRQAANLNFKVWRQFKYWKINSTMRFGPGPVRQHRPRPGAGFRLCQCLPIVCCLDSCCRSYHCAVGSRPPLVLRHPACAAPPWPYPCRIPRWRPIHFVLSTRSAIALLFKPHRAPPLAWAAPPCLKRRSSHPRAPCGVILERAFASSTGTAPGSVLKDPCATIATEKHLHVDRHLRPRNHPTDPSTSIMPTRISSTNR
jgi:hypothetical protein